MKVKETIRRFKYGAQRAQRGFDDRAVWNTDVWLCETLGAILLETSRRSLSYPIDSTHEKWKELLAEHGSALLQYATEQSDEADEAKHALRWVADNLYTLWD